MNRINRICRQIKTKTFSINTTLPKRLLPSGRHGIVVTAVAAVLMFTSVASGLLSLGGTAHAVTISFKDVSQSTTASISKPTNTAEHDFMVAHVCIADDTTITPPSGWVTVRFDTQSNDLRCYVFYKIAGESEPSSYSFSGSEFGAIATYSGVDPVNPINAHNGSNGDSTSATAPSITTTVENAILLAFFAMEDNAAISSVGGMTQRWSLVDSSGASTMGEEARPTAGATGTRVAALPSGERWVAAAIALTPAASPVTFSQTAYRFYQNSNSTNVGTALALQDTPATLESPGQDFRLRMNIHVDEDIAAKDSANFRLQFAGRGDGFCSAPGGIPNTYTDVGIYSDAWSPAIWEQRIRSATTVFDNKLWISGGVDYANRFYNDVWYSSDGMTWKRATSSAEWSPRSSHQMVAFDNKLWILGGYSESGYVTDVWSSPDGITWTQETSDTGWNERSYHQTIVFDDKIWTIGGSDVVNTTAYYDDIWSSSDGKNWTLETDNPGWSGRSNHAVAEYNGKLWLTGGYNGSQINDVWSSADGINWTLETNSPGWSNRSAHAVAAYDNKLWVLGGYDGNNRLDDVWSSSDGESWTQATDSAPWGARDSVLAEVFDNSLWLIGGSTGLAQHDTWSSTNGSNWTRRAGMGWSHRYFHASVVFDNRLWVIGGTDVALRNDVWSSEDGINWTLETASADWSPRTSMEAVVFNGKIWIFGGYDGSTNLDEVWSSPDGVNWTLETSSPGWSQRSYQQVVEFNEKLWLMGGWNGSLNLNDVWSSDDGINWTLETASANWTARSYHQVEVMNGKMWLAGGNSGLAGIDDFNDVWSSEDGINWTLETASADWSPRQAHQLTVLDNKLWLTGGGTETAIPYSDIWTSTDGINWNLEASDTGWHGNFEHTALAHNGKVWLIGGHDSAYMYNSVWSPDYTEITWNFNSSVTSGSPLTVNGNDPIHDGHTTVAQTYTEKNPFSNSIDSIDAGQDAMWDFALKDTSEKPETVYCFRVVQEDGSPIDSYSAYPELSTYIPNTVPNIPDDLSQVKLDDTVITTGDWTNESAVKFIAQVSDPDVDDALQLCVELLPIETAFTGDNEECGEFVPYSGTPVSAEIEIHNISEGEYHWRAKVRDADGLVSDWINYGNNLESDRDVGVDTSNPTGTVYDGSTIGVDAMFNTGSLTTLSANWTSNAGISGLDEYEISIGTSPGNTDVLDWKSLGINMSSTESSLELSTSETYYFNVRIKDNAGNSVVISSNGQLVAPMLTFGSSTNNIDFGSINPVNEASVSQTVNLSVTTNAKKGYAIYGRATDFLTSQSLQIIGMYNGGTYAAPGAWGLGTGFGYHSTDTSVAGVNRFNSATCPGGGTAPCFAPYSMSGVGDIIADGGSLPDGGPMHSDSHTITNRVSINPVTQRAGKYQTTVLYSAYATY